MGMQTAVSHSFNTHCVLHSHCQWVEGLLEWNSHCCSTGPCRKNLSRKITGKSLADKLQEKCFSRNFAGQCLTPSCFGQIFFMRSNISKLYVENNGSVLGKTGSDEIEAVCWDPGSRLL